MTKLYAKKAFALGALFSLVACGDAEPEVPCGEEPVATQKAAPAADAKTAAAKSKSNLKPWTELDDATLAAYGEKVFQAKGSNTCNDCHGKDGVKGRLEQAADLTTPADWDVTKALGGDKAKIDNALAYLISNGGKKFNESFVKDNPDIGWDWSKTEGDSYDIQMFGVTQSSTQAAIKKIRKELKKSGYGLDKSEMNAFGTKAVILYLATIEAK